MIQTLHFQSELCGKMIITNVYLVPDVLKSEGRKWGTDVDSNPAVSLVE